ncbi:hypothetical protein D3C76_1296720 [compost metagenome]
MGIDALEALGNIFATAQPVPERLVAGRVGLLRFAEHAVVLTANLLQAIADGGQETIVGSENDAVEVELDHRSRAHQGLDQAFVLA